MVRLLPAVAKMFETLIMFWLDMFRSLEQMTWFVDESVRFPVVVTVTLHPATVLMLEILNPDIFKNPMLERTMLPPVADESVRLEDDEMLEQLVMVLSAISSVRPDP